MNAAADTLGERIQRELAAACQGLLEAEVDAVLDMWNEASCGHRR